MTTTYLEITYRRGKPFAAYLYLPMPRKEPACGTEIIGSVVVDLAEDGQPIGIEIPSISPESVSDLKTALKRFNLATIIADELRPLEAA